MWPWHDFGGRFSAFKLGVFLVLFVPGALLVADFVMGNIGARPANAAVRETGQWMIRLLFVSLAVTPFREALNWPRLLEIRRMIGVAAFAYGFAHLSLYATQEMWNLAKVVNEIVLRIYLTIGFVGLVGLAALAATSTDAMVRRMGSKWQKLHWSIYVIAVLAAVHFFLQSKANVGEPIMMMGFYIWLMGYRFLRRGRRRPGALALTGLGLGAVAVTAGGEALYYFLKLGVSPLMVLAANLSPGAGFRPAWGVLIGAGLVLVALAVRARRTRSNAPA
jgi:sulfoxide reductase heme-binding subunit YedZ